METLKHLTSAEYGYLQILLIFMHFIIFAQNFHFSAKNFFNRMATVKQNITVCRLDYENSVHDFVWMPFARIVFVNILLEQDKRKRENYMLRY